MANTCDACGERSTRLTYPAGGLWAGRWFCHYDGGIRRYDVVGVPVLEAGGELPQHADPFGSSSTMRTRFVTSVSPRCVRERPGSTTPSRPHDVHTIAGLRGRARRPGGHQVITRCGLQVKPLFHRVIRLCEAFPAH